ncbi:MAG TPA: type I methionyl aminopeptidase [Acidobacteriota bacterium]|jgi:methionyl aminopeptidase
MIICKSKPELEIMQRANQVVAQILGELVERVKPGVTTGELDEYAEARVRELGGEPAFKGYRGFPASLCTSLNEEVVHGIPSRSRHIAPGDVVSMDLGVKLEGFFGDSATTVAVPPVDERVERLLRATEGSLQKAIEQCRVGKRVGDISHAVQAHVEAAGFSVVREFVGHGIGAVLHEDLQIPNFGRPGVGQRLRAGMVLAIEPMVNMGSHEVEVLEDGWTAVTKDRRPSAHFEHSVAITEEGPWVLGAPPRRMRKAASG